MADLLHYPSVAKRTKGDLPHEPLASREIAAFIAAVETGTIQGAADALSLTQSAATKRIQSLERQLGTPLLRRASSGVSPTDAGRSLYPDARRALDALSAAEEAVLGRSLAVTLRLAASHTAGQFLLPDLLALFREEVADVRPQVDVINSPGVLRQVRAGEVDVGFVEGNDPLPPLHFKTVARDEIVVVVAASHRWASRGSLRPSELTAERYITRETGSGTRTLAEHRLEQVDVRLTPELELASVEGVKRALRGGGFTLMSILAVEAEVRAGTLASLRLTDMNLERNLVAVRLGPASPGHIADRFWRWLDANATASHRTAVS